MFLKTQRNHFYPFIHCGHLKNQSSLTIYSFFQLCIQSRQHLLFLVCQIDKYVKKQRPLAPDLAQETY